MGKDLMKNAFKIAGSHNKRFGLHPCLAFPGHYQIRHGGDSMRWNEICDCELERVRDEEARELWYPRDMEKAELDRITDDELFEAAEAECCAARESLNPDDHLIHAREIIELLWYRRVYRD